MRRLLALVALALPLTTGTLCAWGSKKVSLTIHSTPEGAMVSENGKTFGYTPVTLVYTFPDFRSCQPTKPLAVQWVSGATASVDRVQLCPAIGKHQQFTFERPTTTAPKNWLSPALESPVPAPGLDVDLQFAAQRALLAQLEATAAAQASANAWAQAAATAAQFRLPRYCTSTVIGQQIFTPLYGRKREFCTHCPRW